jgi:hypothetical protein
MVKDNDPRHSENVIYFYYVRVQVDFLCTKRTKNVVVSWCIKSQRDCCFGGEG